mmetsp:Transcript_23901/g.39532  ORF Transcript_23901/g.39532 Transcript_23901/m.39532 type:complete len:358 (-) Transcript_23901:166-1239(-)
MDHDRPTAVRAPLKYLGPYPALSLRFPNLSTASQRERNVTGVSLDFILDTAANTNTINAQVAGELGLEVVGLPAPAGLAAGGPMEGGDIFLFGDCELEGLSFDEDEEPFVFMTDLTAAALPVASVASAGLLSLAFLQCFEGGVEFAWGKAGEDGTITEYPSVTFYDDESYEQVSIATVDKASQRAKITPLPITLLPSVTVKVNGVEMLALLDTGSPITVLNAQAAKVAGVETSMDVAAMLESGGNKNPFTTIANKIKVAKAASSGEILTLASSAGQPVYLVKSTDEIGMGIVGDDDKNDNTIDFGTSPLYVGDLPGLAALNGIGENSPPAVVLGMDVLRKRSKMLFRGQQNEVYFSS